MDILQIRYFLAVARAGSFVKAAEEEQIAQPSLSQQIKKLELELGVPLFDRLGRSVCLTRYGRELQQQAELIVKQLSVAKKAVEALKASDEGDLCVGVIPTVLPYAVVKPLAAFRQSFPQVQLDVREMRTDKLIEELRSGEMDLAIVALPIKHEEIVCSELFREPLVAALPRQHPFSSRYSISLREVEDQPMLLLREGHCLRNEVLTACTRAKSKFNNSFETDHLESIFSMVEGGFGVSLVPQMATKDRPGCNFVTLEPKASRRIGYAMAAGHAEMPLQRTFIKFLKAWKW